MLCLRDPADETNDLGRKGIAIKHVQATFRSLSQQLDVDMRDNKRPSILAPFIGTSYMLNHARRAKLQQYGRWLVHQMRLSLAEKAKAIRDAENNEKEVKKELAEEAEREKLAKEERDREWQKSTDERILEAQRTSVLEHGEAMASILGMPSIEQETNPEEDHSTPESLPPISYTPPEKTSNPSNT